MELKKKVKEKLNIKDDNIKDWYWILHNFQGTLKRYIDDEIKYMYNGTYDGGEEYIYIINLNDKTFECYYVPFDKLKKLIHKFDLETLKSIPDDQFIEICES